MKKKPLRQNQCQKKCQKKWLKNHNQNLRLKNLKSKMNQNLLPPKSHRRNQHRLRCQLRNPLPKILQQKNPQSMSTERWKSLV